MAPDPVPEGLVAVMRRAISSAFTAAYTRQSELLSDHDSGIDTFTFKTRGRFTADEANALLRSVSEIANPRGRAGEAAGVVECHDAGEYHGWPSYRGAAIAPTDGDAALGISWRFTIPYRDTVISEVDNLWSQLASDPVGLPEPRPEREPITVGETALHVGPSTTTWMTDGVFSSAHLEDILKPRRYSEGGIELLSNAEVELLERVLRALVEGDRSVLDQVGAYDHGSDPYRWTRDYGNFGDVHFVMPPGDVKDWPVSVMQVDDQPGVSTLIVDMWTREEGASDLCLEINFTTDTVGGSVRGEFVNLHVM